MAPKCLFVLLLCVKCVFCELYGANVVINDSEDDMPKLPLKIVYENLKKNIDSVKKSCGEICDQSIEGKPGKYFDFIEKKVDCEALFSNPDIDDPTQFYEPPKKIPKWLKDNYSYSGRVEIDYSDYFDDKKLQNHYTHWNQTIIDFINKQLEEDKFSGPYGKKYADMIDDFMKNHIELKDKLVMVIGSHTPWIELMAIRNGAKKVLAVDYNEITSYHDQIETMQVPELNKRFNDKTLPKFDIIISYSSVEHSGLGR